SDHPAFAPARPLSPNGPRLSPDVDRGQIVGLFGEPDPDGSDATCLQVFHRCGVISDFYLDERGRLSEWALYPDDGGEAAGGVSDGWEAFFDVEYIRLWGHSDASASPSAQVDGLWTLLGLHPGSRVLDAPCGYGRLSRPLAERGATMLGVD